MTRGSADRDLCGVAESMLAYVGWPLKAIYLGGSAAMGVLKDPHDVDFILFVDADSPRNLRENGRAAKRRLKKWSEESGVGLTLDMRYHGRAKPGAIDCIQVRGCGAIRKDGYDDHDQGSYVDRKMVLLAGEPVLPDYDILGADRDGYVRWLKRAVRLLTGKSIRISEKRWYQAYVGLCILKGGSYELTEEQKANADALHDLRPEDAAKLAELRKRVSAEVLAL